ncbi:LacI family DNA-binding transcriptional regulator [Alkalibacterium sp.]
MAGIKEIAEKAGVSISTVSYALNGSSRVSVKTRDKILSIAEEMNYIPNLAGQNLRRQRTNIIAVYLTSYQGSFFGDLLQGMHQKANDLGMELIVCSGKRSRLFLPQRLIDGILVLDKNFSDSELLKYADQSYPIVVLDRTLKHESIRSVLLDNEKGSTQAMQSLINEGVDKIYIISGPENNHDSIERKKAAVAAAEAQEIEYDIIPGQFNEISGYQAGDKVVFEPEKTYGVFALNDEMGLGIHKYLTEHNIVINKDVFIRGFDRNQVTGYLTPPIKSVAYSKFDFGATAVGILNKLIKEEAVDNKTISTYFEE